MKFVPLGMLSDLHVKGFLKNPGHAGGQGDWLITQRILEGFFPTAASFHFSGTSLRRKEVLNSFTKAPTIVGKDNLSMMEEFPPGPEECFSGRRCMIFIMSDMWTD